MKNPFFCWHTWSKWSEPEKANLRVRLHGSVNYVEVTVQRRSCGKCGRLGFRQLEVAP